LALEGDILGRVQIRNVKTKLQSTIAALSLTTFLLVLPLVAGAAPTAFISSPTNGATVGGTVVIRFGASNVSITPGGATDLILKLDDATILANRVSYNNANPNFSVNWDTSSVSNGPHTLNLEVTDAANLTDTAVVNTTVQNSEGGEGPPDPGDDSGSPTCPPQPGGTIFNPLAGIGICTLPGLYNWVVRAFVAFIGMAAVVAIMIGGYQMVLGGQSGDKEKMTQGKQTVFWALAGLTVVIFAYAIVRVILITVTKQ